MLEHDVIMVRSRSHKSIYCIHIFHIYSMLFLECTYTIVFIMLAVTVVVGRVERVVVVVVVVVGGGGGGVVVP